MAWLGTQPGIVHTTYLPLNLRTWCAETVATLPCLRAVQAIFGGRYSFFTGFYLFVQTLADFRSAATMAHVSMSLVQAIEEVAGPGVDTNSIFPRKQKHHIEPPPASQPNAPPQLRRFVGFALTRYAMISGTICSRCCSTLGSARRRDMDASTALVWPALTFFSS